MASVLADAAKNAGDTETAEQKLAEAVVEMQRAAKISRFMLENYAGVAQDQSDRGAIAVMVEYIYRPLKATVAEWAKE